jgi:phenylpropionate dioxygenase-like ring-hydroxylating dioxygenase large terminal subunit
MLTKEENDLLTETGPGTPCGRLLRSYWQPAALSEELPAGGPPIPLQLFGEELVLFRDEAGQPGLLDAHCSHRGTDLSYGRIEDGGLRCIYHGWLYDTNGQCLATPGEPGGSRLREQVRHQSYPCQEAGGVIFTYMSEGEPPLLPNYGMLSVPADQRLTTKYFHECNYLQALEGNMDSVHVRFLHRFLRTESGTRKLREEHPREMSRGEERSYRDAPLGRYCGPVRVEKTDFGVWAYTRNDAGEEVGGPDFIFPSLCLTGGGPQAVGDGYMLYWRVPVDDTHHWLFLLSFKRSGPIPQEYRDRRTTDVVTADYRFIRNQRNRYLQDREEQRTGTFTGMGSVFVAQDAVANETQRPIQDRTEETLGMEDMSIIAARQMLLQAIRDVQEGNNPPGQIRDPRVNEIDPIFFKKNAPPSEAELERTLAETGGRWGTVLAR